MSGPNTQFNLDVDDIDQIESALNYRLRDLSFESLGETVNVDSVAAEMQRINDLLARLHHQKNWYRPANSSYIGG
jgi:hypothetical protein